MFRQGSFNGFKSSYGTVNRTRSGNFMYMTLSINECRGIKTFILDSRVRRTMFCKVLVGVVYAILLNTIGVYNKNTKTMAYSTPISTLSFPNYLYNMVRLTRVISEGDLLIGGNEGYNDMHPRHSFLHRRLMYIKFHDLVSLFGGFNDHFRLRIEGRCCDFWRIVDCLVRRWFYDRGAGLGYYPSEHYPFEPLEVDMIMFENDVKFSVSFISNAQDLKA